jgi:SAM-dependent methyltransferase
VNSQFESLCRRAVRCRLCFQNRRLSLTAPTIDIAQPRWVGSKYWRAKRRVLILMLNPGSGDSRVDDADRRARRLIRTFACGKARLRKVLDHFQKDAANWGKGRFLDFYGADLGLDVEELAFANVAWCATRGNRYPAAMLDTCFARHTSELLQILNPNVVLLSGVAVHKFRDQITTVLPRAKLVSTFHFAHRKGKRAWLREALRVRRHIRGLSKRKVAYKFRNSSRAIGIGTFHSR